MRRSPEPKKGGAFGAILSGWWFWGVGWSLVFISWGWPESTLAFRGFLREGGNPGWVVDICSQGKVLLRLRAKQRKWAETWTQRILERLNAQAQIGISGADWSLSPQADGFRLEARGQPVVTVTEIQAQWAQMPAKSLAQAWLKNLRETFNQPYLSLPQKEILVPEGGTVHLLVGGRGRGEWTAVLEGTGCSRIRAQPAESRLIVEGLKPGRERLLLRRGNLELRALIWVRRGAGRIRQPVVATVTGRSPPQDFLAAAVRNALWSAAEVRPGGDLEIAPALSLPPRLGLRDTAQVQVPVEIRGPGYQTFVSTVPVTLRNQPWTPREADLLLVSNDPETITRPGLLAQSQLQPQQPVRVLYHHKNGSSVALYLGAELANLTACPAQVHLQHRVFGPDRDEIYVGHRVTRAFWQDRLQGNGYQIRIPPRGIWPLLSRRMGPQTVLSGLAEVQVQSSQPLLCRVLAYPEGSPSLPVDPTAPQPSWSYPHPHRTRKVTYRVGERHTFISIGRDPLINRSQRPLWGNYGVLYTVDLTLSNPTPQEAPTEIVFSADGGVARGILIINGQITETGLVPASGEERLYQVLLPPRRKRRLRLQIMPQAGSNYPLRLVVRPQGPAT